MKNVNWNWSVLAMLLAGVTMPAMAEDKPAEKKPAEAIKTDEKPADKGKSAEPAASAKPKKKSPVEQQINRHFQVPAAITLSDEQKTKWEDVKKEFRPKVEELAVKREAIFTKEQKKARREANKTAQAEGKKGKALQAAVTEALNLSEEQKKQVAEVDGQLKELAGKIRESLEGLLTAEQKESLPKPKKNKKVS